MKNYKFLLPVLILAIAVGIAQAYRPPAFDGGCGLFKVSSARTLGKGQLSVGFLHSDFSGTSLLKGDPFYQGDMDSANPKPDKQYRGKTRLIISYAPLDFFEFSIGPRLYATYDRHSNVEGTTGRYDGKNFDLALFWLENMLLKTKFSYQSKEYGGAPFSYAVGLEPFVSIGFPVTTAYMYTDDTDAPDKPDSNLVNHGFTELIPYSPDFGAKFLGTLSLGPASLHGNLGFLKAGKAKEGFIIDTTWVWADTTQAYYLADSLAYRADSANSKVHPAIAGTGTREDQLLWGAGIEVAAGPYVTFLVEASGEKLKSHTFTYGSPARITPGIRFNTPGGFTIDGGCEFKLFKNAASPNWNAVFGFSVTSATIKKTPPPPPTVISGRVQIAGTDSSLQATMTSAGINNGAPIPQNPDGSYSVNVLPGTYRIRAAAGDSFLWQEKAVTVAAGQSVIVDFGIRRKEFPKGIITGKITDKKTGNAMGATINVFGPDKQMVGTVTSDLMTGIFSIGLPPNIYMVQAQAEGYNVETAPVPVNDKQTFIQNFAMRMIPKKGEKVVLTGIKFKSNRADIIPSSYSILDEAAKLLKENPTIKVEIGGHTDSRGSDAKNQRLSEARAVSVRNYLINIHGIAGDRLTAKGYGESLPIASNKTAKGRAENRRIEFVVMGQ